MNDLSLRLRMQPTLAQILRCGVCEQPIDPEDATEVQVRLFGATQYGVCVGCGQGVEAPHSRVYKWRWGQRYRMLAAHPVPEHKRGRTDETTEAIPE